MPFLLTQQGSTFRPVHVSRAAPCLPSTQQTQAPSRPCVAVWAKKVAASELRQLSDDDLLKQVAKSQYEIVQLQWKQSRKEVKAASARDLARCPQLLATKLLIQGFCNICRPSPPATCSGIRST